MLLATYGARHHYGKIQLQRLVKLPMKVGVALESVPLVFEILSLLGKLLVTLFCNPQAGLTLVVTCVVRLDPQCPRGATNGLLVQKSQTRY